MLHRCRRRGGARAFNTRQGRVGGRWRQGDAALQRRAKHMMAGRDAIDDFIAIIIPSSLFGNVYQ
jgi:hypothetical protein